MDNVSRPMIALLVGTVAFFALWLVALKPSSPTGTKGSSGLGVYQSAIDKAHQAVKTAAAASVARGGTVPAAAATTPTAGATTPGPAATAPASALAAPAAATRAAAGSAPARASVTPVRSSPATTHRLNVVAAALHANRVIALLFYNPAGADDRAVKQELAAVPTSGGRVVKLAVPLAELARYTVLTNQVAVQSSPTLVLVDGDQQATTIVGFADRFEIAQRVSDALAVK